MTEKGTDAGVQTDSEWIRRWHEGDAYWHSDAVSPYLSKNSETILAGSKKRIFLPLCGKAVELTWLRERGHEVVGVEIAELPVKELFEENSIEYDVENFPNVGNLYTSKDGLLSVWAANIFNVSSEQYGKFDIIWDAKSFVAINLSDHNRYFELMHTIMNPNCVYYLQTLEYDPTVWPGPPHSITNETVDELFSGAMKVDIVEEMDLNIGKPNEAQKGENTAQMEKKIVTPDPAILAIATSSYKKGRWYRMTRK